MGRATASVQSRTLVVLVHLQYIPAKIHSKCAPQPKIAKNSLKTRIFGVVADVALLCQQVSK